MTHTQMVGAVVLAFVVSNAISLLSLVMSRIESARLRTELTAIRSELKNLRAGLSGLRDLLGAGEQPTRAGEGIRLEDPPVKQAR